MGASRHGWFFLTSYNLHWLAHVQSIGFFFWYCSITHQGQSMLTRSPLSDAFRLHPPPSFCNFGIIIFLSDICEEGWISFCILQLMLRISFADVPWNWRLAKVALNYYVHYIPRRVSLKGNCMFTNCTSNFSSANSHIKNVYTSKLIPEEATMDPIFRLCIHIADTSLGRGKQDCISCIRDINFKQFLPVKVCCSPFAQLYVDNRDAVFY